jgi:hypothetical protein
MDVPQLSLEIELERAVPWRRSAVNADRQA